MKVELLYFDGCPNWQNTLVELHEVLDDLGVATEVDVVHVKTNADAERLAFAGSPTVRIDGVDVEPNPPAGGYALDCRLYWIDGKVFGAPPREWLVRAVGAALREAS